MFCLVLFCSYYKVHIWHKINHLSMSIIVYCPPEGPKIYFLTKSTFNQESFHSSLFSSPNNNAPKIIHQHLLFHEVRPGHTAYWMHL